jgi:type VI secretion system secreted protein Hcp
VIVTSYQNGGSSAADAAPTDQVGLNFARIRVTYQPFNADGSKGVAVEAGWDIPNNKAL